MKRIIVTLMLAAACTCAMAQSVKDSLWDDDKDIKDLNVKIGESKWEINPTFGFTYNYSFNAPAGLSASGWGMDFSLLEMQWHGWKSGSITLGILDFLVDFQFLQKGFSFDGITAGGIAPALDGKGQRTDFAFGFPVGINQQFGEEFGISLIAVPAIGFYTYKNNYNASGFHHSDTLYPRNKRVGFSLDLKATLWYGNIGVLARYQPLATPDMNTTILSVGIAFRTD